MHLKEKRQITTKKACEKGTFHITQLIQVNVFFFFYRPQLKNWKKKKVNLKMQPKEKKKNLKKQTNKKTSAGYYASPKLILLFFGVPVNSSTTLIPANKLQCTKRHFFFFFFSFFLIKTTQHSQVSVQLHIYKSYRAKACQCRHLGSQGTDSYSLTSITLVYFA